MRTRDNTHSRLRTYTFYIQTRGNVFGLLRTFIIGFRIRIIKYPQARKNNTFTSSHHTSTLETQRKYVYYADP